MINGEELQVEVGLINPEWPLRIYKGDNVNGYRVYSVISKYEPKTLLSTKLISVHKMYKPNRDEWQILFSLTSSSDSSKDMFKYIFRDIIKAIDFSQSEKKALETLCYRYEHWQQLLSKVPDSFGSLKQQGLMAELLVLKEDLIPKYGVSEALEMWQGPKGGKQDFILSDSWIEVKSTILGKRDIRISSLEQLDSDISEGELVVVTVQESNVHDSKAISLTMVIDEIDANINEDLLLNKFRENLLLVGYGSSQADEVYFRIISKDYYSVTNDFPKIKRNDISTAIKSVSYNLNLDSISEFKIS